MRMLFPVIFFSISALAQTPEQTPADSAPQQNGCMAVKSIGSHVIRNAMLGGLAGVLLSKERYQVVDTVGYPAKIGQKYHGNDLQMIQNGGTKVVILPKKYSGEDLRQACLR